MAITKVSDLAHADSAGLITLPDVAANDTIVIFTAHRGSALGEPHIPVYVSGGSGIFQLDATFTPTTGGFPLDMVVQAWSCQPSANIAAGVQVNTGVAIGTPAAVNDAAGAVFNGIALGSVARLLNPSGGVKRGNGAAALDSLGPVDIENGLSDGFLLLAFGSVLNVDWWPWDDGTFNINPITPPPVPGVILSGITGLASLATLERSGTTNSNNTTGFPGDPFCEGIVDVEYVISTNYSDRTLDAAFTNLIGGISGTAGFSDFPAGLEQSAYSLGLLFYRAAVSGASGPWNLETRGGQYHFAYPSAGTIYYRQSYDTRPVSYSSSMISGGGSDSQFRMTEETYPAGRVRGVWVRSNAVVEAHSDDDGATWSTPVTLWSSAKNPTVCHDPRTGYTAFFAYVTDHLEGRVQAPGSTSPAAAFSLKTGGSNIPVDDATFHVSPAADAPGRWLLVLVDAGAVKSYMSTDEGQNWAAA